MSDTVSLAEQCQFFRKQFRASMTALMAGKREHEEAEAQSGTPL